MTELFVKMVTAAVAAAIIAIVHPAHATMPLSEWATGGCDVIGQQLKVPATRVMDWRQACTEFRATLDTSPENLEANMLLCTLGMLRMRNYVNAEPDILKKAPRDVRYYILYGCYQLVGDLPASKASEGAKKHMGD